MSRLTNFLELLSNEETFLVSNYSNIRYLSGFTGSNSLLVISRDKQLIITDPRYDIQSRAEVDEFEIVVASDIWDVLNAHLVTETLSVEGLHLSVSRRDLIAEASPKIQISPKTGVIEKLRTQKDESEISKIRAACEIATESLERVISDPIIGLTEIELSRKIENNIKDLGAEALAFESIVASGPNSAIPHHKPTDRVITKGDLLKIDFGAQYQGYKSDCTRTFAIGSAKSWQSEIHQATLDAQAQGRNAVAAGIELVEVDKVVRKELTRSGYLQYFTHGLGHGVGLDIHEDPFLGIKSKGNIAKNMVITIEPGIYLEAQGGVRIEDTGVVTDSGYEVFTNFTYELLELN